MSERHDPVSKDEFERLRRLEIELRAQILDVCVADNVSRDELYERHADVSSPTKPAIQDDQ